MEVYGEGSPGAQAYFAYIQVKMSQASVDEPKTSNRIRFELELEFVQALANPYYLHSLAQQGILNQPAFVNYLHYLLYWKEKEYARFVQCVSSNNPEVVIVISHQVPPRPPSPRAATTRAVPFRDRQRPVARVSEPEAVRPLANVVRVPLTSFPLFLIKPLINASLTTNTQARSSEIRPPQD